MTTASQEREDGGRGLRLALPRHQVRGGDDESGVNRSPSVLFLLRPLSTAVCRPILASSSTHSWATRDNLALAPSPRYSSGCGRGTLRRFRGAMASRPPIATRQQARGRPEEGVDCVSAAP